MPQPLKYQIPTAEWHLELSAPVVAFLLKRRQRSMFSKESVGQLFTLDFTEPTILINQISRLPVISSSYSRVRFDSSTAAEERQAWFQKGFHCAGLWHTHPEPEPRPSSEDGLLAKDYAAAAKLSLNAIVFVIVGTADFPRGLGVWIHDGKRFIQAFPYANVTV